AQSVARRVEDDEELSVAPAFFETLWQENASIARVELRAKDGVLDNEMNKFRYDVVLHVGDGDRAVRVAPDVAAFERDIGGKSAREQSLAAWMADADGPATLGELLDGSAHDAVPARDAKTRGRSGGAAVRPYSDPLRRRRRHARAGELRRRLATDRRARQASPPPERQGGPRRAARGRSQGLGRDVRGAAKRPGGDPRDPLGRAPRPRPRGRA